MDVTTIISLVSMGATILSTFFAFKARNDVVKTKQEILKIKSELSLNQSSNIIENKGTNSGVQASTIHGGIRLNDK